MSEAHTVFMAMKRARYLLIGIAAISTCALIFWVFFYRPRPSILEMYVFSASSGRALFVRTPEDARIVFDSGGASEAIARITRILPFYSRRIDAIVITSSAGKDMSGAVDILGRYSVGAVYVPAHTPQSLGLATSSDQIYDAFLALAAERSISVRQIFEGDTVPLSPSVSLRALFPASPEHFTYSKTNQPGLAFTLAFGSTSLAYIGSLSKKAQGFAASSTALVGHSLDALVFSRSLAPTAISKRLIDVSRPAAIVFSGPKSPSKSSGSPVRKLSKEARAVSDVLVSIPAYDIRRLGSIRVVSDGHAVSIEPWH